MSKKGIIENVEASDSLVPPMTRGETIVREMSLAGFVEVKEGTAANSRNYSEFRKLYTDPSGTTGLCTALVRKDAAGVEPETLEGFVLTVQKHLKAIPEDVHAGAWKFAQFDMLHLVDAIGAADEAVTHVMVSTCERCKVIGPEFVVHGKEKLCPKCFGDVGI